MLNNERGAAVQWVIVGLLAVVVILLVAPHLKSQGTAKFDTPYQAVLLTGGQVYYGKLEGLGTQYPVLQDVYYVQRDVNPETKQVNSVLVRRGKEWHGPDKMYLNPAHIIIVEPVAANSKMAQLIAEASKQ